MLIDVEPEVVGRPQVEENLDDDVIDLTGGAALVEYPVPFGDQQADSLDDVRQRTDNVKNQDDEQCLRDPSGRPRTRLDLARGRLLDARLAGSARAARRDDAELLDALADGEPYANEADDVNNNGNRSVERRQEVMQIYGSDSV